MRAPTRVLRGFGVGGDGRQCGVSVGLSADLVTPVWGAVGLYGAVGFVGTGTVTLRGPTRVLRGVGVGGDRKQCGVRVGSVFVWRPLRGAQRGSIGPLGSLGAGGGVDTTVPLRGTHACFAWAQPAGAAGSQWGQR